MSGIDVSMQGTSNDSVPYCQGVSCAGCVFLEILFDCFNNPIGCRCTKK